MIGRTLGHYTVLDRLGAGGMGVVYRARDERLKREVALKVLPAEQISDASSRARLMREARLASSLGHPHICVIHEVDEQDGEMFVAMELVRGGSLHERIPKGGLPVAEMIRLGGQIADALTHAHSRGVIHRDLKSLNVMVTPEGFAKVLDFGLARPVVKEGSSTIALSARLTETGALVGTVHSMAPEVLQGGEADERSDLWALGVLLHEMAGGESPFGGDTAYEVAGAVLHAEPAPLPERVPAGLREVIAHCLKKDPAQRIQAAADVRVALERVAAGVEPKIPQATSPKARGRIGRSTLGWAAGLTIAAVTTLLLLGQYRGCPGGAAIRSIAVLPMVNLSGDASQEYFVDGMTDELITDLAGIGMLRVIAHGSVMAYKSTRKPLAQIARELGVDALVEGSVSRSGDRVRIRADLARARTGESIWAESFERNVRDVLSLQTEVARAIAGRIRVRLAPPEEQRLTHTRPVDPAVLQDYLKGRFAWNRYTLEGFEEAERQFQAAIDVDPSYAPAWAGLADAAYGMSSIFIAPEIALSKARAAAQRSLSLDSTLAAPHVSIGIVKMVHDWDWKGAQASFDRAIALEPSSAYAHWWRSHLCLCQGRFEEATKEEAIALDLDPLSSWYVANQGWRLMMENRNADAEQFLRSNLDLYPNDYFFHVYLGLALSREGKSAEAVRELEKGVAMDENNDDLCQLAYVYGVAGRVADVHRIIARLEERRSKAFVPAASLALCYAGLRNEDETMRWLEAAVEDHSEMVCILGVDPGFDWMRANPRFQTVLRKLGLENARR